MHIANIILTARCVQVIRMTWKNCWRGGCGQPDRERESERERNWRNTNENRHHAADSKTETDILTSAAASAEMCLPVIITTHCRPATKTWKLRRWTWICLTGLHLYGWQGQQTTCFWIQRAPDFDTWTVPGSWPGKMGGGVITYCGWVSQTQQLNKQIPHLWCDFYIFGSHWSFIRQHVLVQLWGSDSHVTLTGLFLYANIILHV